MICCTTSDDGLGVVQSSENGPDEADFSAGLKISDTFSQDGYENTPNLGLKR